MNPVLQSFIDEIHQPSAGLTAEGQAHLDSLTKPVGSLGRLEELALKLWRIQGKRPLSADPARMYTVAADHGVTEEGISLYPPSVTRQMVENFLHEGAAINVLCNTLGIEHMVVDAGCMGEEFPSNPKLISMKAGEGTANFAKGPAMSNSQLWECLNNGITLATIASEAGVRCIGLGEMGIGNTTAASALFSAYLNLRPEEITGPGAGLPPGGLAHKSLILYQALKENAIAIESDDPLLILRSLGGFEIATLTGIIMGAAKENMVVMVDGFITTAAYVAAWKICPAVSDYCMFSHSSKETGHELVLSYLNRKPLLNLDMRLGEGTGAALGIALLRSAAAIFNDMATFESANISGPKETGGAGAK